MMEFLKKWLGMGGWKTWTGISIGTLTALAEALGLDLTPEQLSAIQLIVISIIGWGVGHKVEKTGKAVEVLTTHTAMVANQVGKVERKIEAPFKPVPQQAPKPWPFNERHS